MLVSAVRQMKKTALDAVSMCSNSGYTQIPVTLYTQHVLRDRAGKGDHYASYILLALHQLLLSFCLSDMRGCRIGHWRVNVSGRTVSAFQTLLLLFLSCKWIRLLKPSG